MSTVNERHDEMQESVECDAKCNHCGALILQESQLTGAGVPIPYRRVRGQFVQFLNDEGEPFGPWWGYCQPCFDDGMVSNPIEMPEVQAARGKYEKLFKEIQ